MSSKNNIFKFATSELSQDAIICWICNNWNLDNTRLRELANEVIRGFIPNVDLGEITNLKIEQQKYKIDVLLVVNEKYAIIIEDKRFSTVHGNQINNYRKEVEENKAGVECLKAIDKQNIITVYLKTGFFYPCDNKAIDKGVNVVINGEQWYKLLGKYRGASEILDDYIEKLNDDNNWYKDIENKYKTIKKDEMDIENEEYKKAVKKVLEEHYGQYLFMKDMFSGIDDKLDSFYQGSSIGGRPWTEYTILADIPYPSLKTHNFEIFYRIDRNKYGYYVSIRQYDKNFDKKDIESTIVNAKKVEYDKLNIMCRNIVNNITGMDKGAYTSVYNKSVNYESEVGYFTIGKGDREISLSVFSAIFKKFHKEFNKKLNDQYIEHLLQSS